MITADHTSFGTYPEYMTDLGLYSVPILFYAPSMPELRGMEDKIVEQIDIMPLYWDCWVMIAHISVSDRMHSRLRLLRNSQ